MQFATIALERGSRLRSSASASLSLSSSSLSLLYYLSLTFSFVVRNFSRCRCMVYYISHILNLHPPFNPTNGMKKELVLKKSFCFFFLFCVLESSTIREDFRNQHGFLIKVPLGWGFRGVRGISWLRLLWVFASPFNYEWLREWRRSLFNRNHLSNEMFKTIKNPFTNTFIYTYTTLELELEWKLGYSNGKNAIISINFIAMFRK